MSWFYLRCSKCHAMPGKPCKDLRVGFGTIKQPHHGRARVVVSK